MSKVYINPRNQLYSIFNINFNNTIKDQESALLNPVTTYFFVKGFTNPDIIKCQDAILNYKSSNERSFAAYCFAVDFSYNYPEIDIEKCLLAAAESRICCIEMAVHNFINLPESIQMLMATKLNKLYPNITSEKAIEKWHRLNNMKKACL